MNTFKRTTLILVLLTGFLACKNEPKPGTSDSVPEKEEVVKSKELAFNDTSMSVQFQHYLHLKTALVNSDLNEALSGAAMLKELTENAELQDVLEEISGSEDLEHVRTLFAEVTENITSDIKSSITHGEVYIQFCPMAFNNEGGYWLSTEEEIRNPYFGDKMLTCGKVSETISN